MVNAETKIYYSAGTIICPQCGQHIAGEFFLIYEISGFVKDE